MRSGLFGVLIIVTSVLACGCDHAVSPVTPTSASALLTQDAHATSTFWLSLDHRKWTTGLTVAWPFANDAAGSLTATFGLPHDPALSYMFTASPSTTPKGTYSATVRLVGTGMLLPWDGSPTTPTARLFVFAYNNTWSVDRPDARWWSNPVAFPLVATDWTTLAVALADPSQWSDVNGQLGSDIPSVFAAALSHVSSLGVTFGGEFFGHGAYGSVQQLQIQRIGVQ